MKAIPCEKLPRNWRFRTMLSTNTFTEQRKRALTRIERGWATCFSTCRSRSLSLCGIHHRGWAVVAPRCFHFPITALTVDQGSSSKAEIWQTDLLKRWHPMTVPHRKSLSSSVRPFYCQCFVYGDCMAVYSISFIHLSATVVAETAETTHMKWFPHTYVCRVAG